MKYQWVMLAVFSVLLGACSKGGLDSPCPNYGQYCSKRPINSWDYYQGDTK